MGEYRADKVGECRGRGGSGVSVKAMRFRCTTGQGGGREHGVNTALVAHTELQDTELKVEETRECQ